MRATLVLLCAAVTLAAASGEARAGTTTSPAAQMKAVVRAWSANLDRDDNVGAAKLFTVPAVVIQAPYTYRLRTRAEIALWHSLLPCAGHIVSITVRGSTATAVFRLADRPGSKCDAPGQLAAARFTFAHGKIVRWEQVAVPANAAPGPAA
jgi:hypothetical protein